MATAKNDGLIGSFLRFRDRVAIWCATLTLLGAAVFLWSPPAEVVEEISWHRELAAGCGIFGGLMLLAVVLRGQAGYRVRALLLVGLAALVGTGLFWWLQGTAEDVRALMERGEIRRVQVLGTTMRHNPKTKTTTRLTQVGIDGRTVSVDLKRLPRRGEWVEVLVAADRPSAIVGADVEREWVALIDRKIGLWVAAVAVFASLFCLVSLPINLWHFLFGAARGTDPDKDRP